MSLEKLQKKSIQVNKLGCYAVGSIFWSKESSVCQSCAMRKECANSRLDSSFDSGTHSALVASLPVKAGRVLSTLFKTDKAQQIRTQLRQRKNALENKTPKFLSVAIDQLIIGGFDKRSLRNALIERLNCTDKTAFGWVSITVPVLDALDVLKETHGYYRINT